MGIHRKPRISSFCRRVLWSTALVLIVMAGGFLAPTDWLRADAPPSEIRSRGSKGILPPRPSEAAPDEAPIPEAALLGEDMGHPSGQIRFGVATNRNPLSFASYTQLEMGWYHRWSLTPWNWAAIPGVEFYPMVGAWGDLWGSETESDIRYYVGRITDCYPPGTIWIIGNEPQYDYFDTANGEPIPGGARTITYDEYAQKYKKYYDIIKSIDSTYRVAVAATFRGYLRDVQQAYESRYGQKMPIDVYNVHAYMHANKPDILDQVKAHVNSTREIMNAYGDRDKWLIITEIGALWDPGADVVTSFMRQAFDYLTTETSSTLGCPSDANRMVQRWAWFLLTEGYEGKYKGSDLIELSTGALTPVGQTYANYPKELPMPPSGFWGTVTLHGRNVPAGTLVTAWIGSTKVGETTTTLHGGASVYSLDVPADDPDTPGREGGNEGEIVTLRVENALESPIPTGTWRTGSVVQLGVVGHWAMPGDIPVSGDVDGDGKMDLIFWRPSNGNWYILSSSDSYTSYLIRDWGRKGDVPVSGDVDGDGKMDLIVWRPSNGNWYVLYSTHAYSYSTYFRRDWGRKGDVPVSGDVDGDGKMDLIVWRPSNGNWYVLYSSGGYSYSDWWHLKGETQPLAMPSGPQMLLAGEMHLQGEATHGVLTQSRAGEMQRPGRLAERNRPR